EIETIEIKNIEHVKKILNKLKKSFDNEIERIREMNRAGENYNVHLELKKFIKGIQLWRYFEYKIVLITHEKSIKEENVKLLERGIFNLNEALKTFPESEENLKKSPFANSGEMQKSLMTTLCNTKKVLDEVLTRHITYIKKYEEELKRQQI
ncbi:MAG: hypothetical protein KAS15_09240, partial [Nanoarchaeota archaeon]|nr:hypothetical protein [Nanoarchaeota archaeon]